MARYTDIDKLIAEYDRVHVGAPGGARKLMVEAPIADVAPRAEVDRLRELNNFLLEAGQEWQKRYENLAREIFEEIEFDIHQLMFDRDETRAIAIEGIIANLKKKYTEGKDDT